MYSTPPHTRDCFYEFVMCAANFTTDLQVINAYALHVYCNCNTKYV